MNKNYISIPVMVLMIGALVPGAISGDCENCSTEDIMPYTPEDLEKYNLEVEDFLDEQSITIMKKIGSLSKLFEDPPTEKNEELSKLLDSLYKDYIYYLHYNYQKATLKTIAAMTTESGNYLIIDKIIEPVDQPEVEDAYLLYEDLTLKLDYRYDTLELYYDHTGETQVDYGVLFDDILSLYNEATDLNTRYASLVAEYAISLQAETQEILTRSIVICDTPGAGDSLQANYPYYMASFAWVKAWIGVYSTVTPDMAYKIGDICTGTKNTLEGYLAIANSTYGSENVGSIQVKYFFLANQGIHQHNVIYEGNISNSNINGYRTVGDRPVYFTNGVGWTYGVSYDGSSTPSNGTYRFSIYADWLITQNACCIPSWPPDNTVYAQWCNKHCGGCFACDEGGDQNFVTDES